MNNIKNSFFIQDLEVYSGIKAHTIRIWEKRYNLLHPTRLNRNIRKYSLEDLQKLLNVSLLYNKGYKISKLSKLSEEELQEETRKLSLETIESNYHVNILIVSMYSFDSLSFEKSYQELVSKVGFEFIFTDVYIPLLDHIGVLWQTDAIKPAHEHFISNLISQKIILNTALVSPAKILETTKVFVLFLPEGEIHELGLLYLNYRLKKLGAKSIYLGRSVPFSNLEFVSNEFDDIVWLCPFVIGKSMEEKQEFLKQFSDMLSDTNNKGYLTGTTWDGYEVDPSITDQIYFIPSFKKLEFLD